MNRPITLSLFVGPVIPIPAPRVVAEALTEVTTQAGSGGDGFELKFNMTNDSSVLQTLFLIAAGGLKPLIRVVIAVTINGAPEVLMDGVVTRTELSPDTGSGPTQLIVKGSDISTMMDRVDFSGLLPYPAMPIEARVALILAKYAVLGMVPAIIPTPTVDLDNPLQRIDEHWGTDLVYVRDLADRAGYTFYVEPGPVIGASIAYWGPVLRVGSAQKALNVDMDTETNVESISCSFENDSSIMPIIAIENPITRFPPIPIPAGLANPLDPPLGLIPPIPTDFEIVADSARKSFPRALMYAWAEQAASNRVVSAKGTLDTLRYGQVLKPRRLVGLRGVGTAFDGLYYVDSVSSKVERGKFKQDFALARNGLISTLDRIPT